MKRLAWFVFVMIIICPCAVFGVPDVVKGRFVYTVPAGFDPPLIGRSGVAEIQEAAAKLRYPYYVVLVERFDGESDEDAARYIDSLAEKWQMDPDFDSSKSCIFMLSYEPRKYRFLAGSRWENEIGFGPGAHRAFNAIFEGYVRSARKDPRTGIIRMMQAVDRHIIDHTDPEVIAARKEAERKAELARREAEKKALEETALEMARDQLRVQVAAMDELLMNEPRFLPKGVDKYRSAREGAYDLVSGTDRQKMSSQAAALRLLNGELKTYVDARKRVARDKAMRLAGRVGSASAGIIIVLLLVTVRAVRFGRLRRGFDEQSRGLEEKIINAQPKYLAFEQERGMILGLRELTGRTKEVYDTTTREVDDIFITIGALQNHVDSCRSSAGRGSFFNIKPLERALSKLDSHFTFDTNQLDKLTLFSPEKRQITLKSSEAVAQLEARFGRAIEQWEHLKKAAEVRLRQAEDVFSQDKLDEMLKTAQERGIPQRWLSDHPLFGDDESDKALYTGVNEGRWNDPVAFLERLEDLQAKEAEVADRLERVIRSMEIVEAEHVDSAPDMSMTVLQPQDDPLVTFDAARREEARFAAMIASRAELSEVEEQAGMVRDLYRKCVEQTVMAQAAVRDAGREVAEVGRLAADTAAVADHSEAQVRERELVHSNIRSAENSLANGRRYLEAGRMSLESAVAILAQRKHLDAQNTAGQARKQLEEAGAQFAHCRKQCEELDEAKRCFEERLANLDDRRRQFERQMKRYGASPNRLDKYNHIQVNTAVDYLRMLGQLDALESSWENDVRQARRIHEAEELRRREAEEERRRRDSDSGFGGSSGGGWGGSSSSSSGGSWGGGSSRSSSSGGSW